MNTSNLGTTNAVIANPVIFGEVANDATVWQMGTVWGTISSTDQRRSMTEDASDVTFTGRRHMRAIQSLVMVFLMFVSAVAFGRDKLSPDFAKVKKTDTVDVIIRYNRATNSADADDVAKEGGRFKKHLRSLNGAAITIRRDKLEKLIAKHPELSYVALDRPLTSSMFIEENAVGAYVAWNYGFDGRGVGVAVVDSGIASHADLNNPATGATRVVYGESFLSTDPSPKDKFGHGTHVAGIIGGNGAASNGKYKGIAPAVNLIDLRALDDKGQGKDSDVIAAIERAIELKDQYNIRVLNLSIGRAVFESYQDDPLCQAVEAAWNAGIFVVVAAGNEGRNNSAQTDGYGTITAPGNDPYVITVGAVKTNGTLTKWDDQPASYSSKGPSLGDHIVKPDVVAPGNNVISLLASTGTLAALQPTSVVSSTGGAKYFKMSGTSMATPMVAGAAALLLQQNPNLTPDQLKARFMKSAWKGLPYTSLVWDKKLRQWETKNDIFTVGAGYLDIPNALFNQDLAPATSGSAKSPAVSYDAVKHTVRMIADGSTVFGSGIIWGGLTGPGTQGIIWGGVTQPAADGALWSTGIIWGGLNMGADGLIAGEGIIWGGITSTDGIAATGIIWGGVTGGVDANGIIWGGLNGADAASGIVWGNDVGDTPDLDDQDPATVDPTTI